MRILFIPSDAGGGFGHVSRCLALSHAAQRRGHESLLLLSDSLHIKRLKKKYSVIPLVSFSFPFFRRKEKGKMPLFIEVPGIEYQAIRDKLYTCSSIVRAIKKLDAIVKKNKPDIIVGDSHLLAWCVSRLNSIPIVQVVRFVNHPYAPSIIWWKDVPSDSIPQDVLHEFNRALEKLSLPSISRVAELLQGDTIMIPSIPEIEPLPLHNNNFFVGDLTVESKVIDQSFQMPAFPKIYPLVYITVGGGALHIDLEPFFMCVINAFSGKPYNVIVSTAGKKYTRLFTQNIDNIAFCDWVPGRSIIACADLVIFHGGYGTMMEVVRAGKPSIVIPFHSEQESNGRRLECLGVACVLSISDAPFQKKEIVSNYYKYSLYMKTEYTLSPSVLRETVQDMIKNESYTQKARALKEKSLQYGGTEMAVDIMEKML
jgi:UDP:flavonoid glycosyltransferase YjiC (YdhE family)